MTSSYSDSQKGYKRRIDRCDPQDWAEQNQEVLKEARLEGRDTSDLFIEPGAAGEDWVLNDVKTADGRTPEYIFLHFGRLNINNQNYSNWYTPYRLPSGCEWIYISVQRMKANDMPAAKALAIYPKRESTSQRS